MDLTARRPGIEIAAEWIAACCLGGAVGFAALKLASVGLLGVLCMSVVAAVAALLVQGLAGRDRGASVSLFEPTAYPDKEVSEYVGEYHEVLLLDAPVDADELLLDTPLVDADELLLDTPIVSRDGSRVVRLFGDATQPGADAAAIPAPGEMLARIEDFLGVARGSAAAAEPASHANLPSADASAALHAALADIRRSLRQG
jgi:hypothetical protein